MIDLNILYYDIDTFYRDYGVINNKLRIHKRFKLRVICILNENREQVPYMNKPVIAVKPVCEIRIKDPKLLLMCESPDKNLKEMVVEILKNEEWVQKRITTAISHCRILRKM